MQKKTSENSVCQSSIYKVVILIAQLQKKVMWYNYFPKAKVGSWTHLQNNLEFRNYLKENKNAKKKL